MRCLWCDVRWCEWLSWFLVFLSFFVEDRCVLISGNSYNDILWINLCLMFYIFSMLVINIVFIKCGVFMYL